MKMKITQRIGIGFSRTKIKTIALISEKKAAELAFDLFCTPYRNKTKHKSPFLFHKSEQLVFGLGNIQIYGWFWKPLHSNGKKILIVHGLNSNSFKFEKYVSMLTIAGFEVLTFDAPGHGLSGGKRINALLYSKLILEINKKYGPLYGIMAHSLGGLAAALAAEKLNTIAKLVLIAPATETITAINNFFKFFNLPDSLKKTFEEVLEEIAQRPVSYFSVSRSIPLIHSNILWLHDSEDKVCPFKDVEPIQQMNLPNVSFYITKGLGHSNIYKEQKVANTIVSFFTSA